MPNKHDSYYSRCKIAMHQFILQIKSLSPFRKLVLVLASCTLIVIVGKAGSYVFLTNLSDHTENTKCPACFGTRMCKRIHETTIHGKEKLHHINRLTNVKNIYYGMLNGMEFVYKKLGHDDELLKVDRLICSGGLKECDATYSNQALCTSFQEKNRCSFTESVNHLISTLPDTISPELIKGLSDAVRCPTPRLITRIMDKYQERSVVRHVAGLNSNDRFMLLYTLTVNPEPIILQTFPGEEGWPFPPYIGACGRMIAVENAGKPLREYFNTDWKTRMKLSLSLLFIADQLTDNAVGFKLFFTDINLDNYVVDDNLKIVIADAENIIIVDAVYVHQVYGSDSFYRAPFDDCPQNTNCLSIDVNSLCSHSESDFNFYALCRSLLSGYAQDEQGMSGGLLHSAPNNSVASNIVMLANTCAKPEGKASRFEIKDKLIAALEDAIKNS